jgi:membrane-bound lytic murein transglycosylase D
VKPLCIFLAFLFLTGAVFAQPATNAPTQPLDSKAIQDWMHNNLDDSVVNLINQVDQDRVRDFFNKLQQRFDATNIADLGSMKDVAVQVLPVLKQFDETRPYAAWLEAHLDELDTADQIQRSMKTNSVAHGVPVRPSLKLQRSIWVRQLHNRPWPPLARTYVPKLKEVFLAENTPPALVWLAEVESGFDPSALSPAGAAGMFQLMPMTAKSEDLSLWPFDQRYQPEKSADAAARYLRELHHHYADWPLAVAAYNVGESRLDKLLKEHKAHSFDAVARWLPAETQMYVPKVEAVVRLREGLSLADLKMPNG